MVTLNGKVQYPDTILEDLSGRVKTHVIEGTRKAIAINLWAKLPKTFQHEDKS